MSFIWNVVVVEVGFQKFYSDHFVFIRKTSSGTIIFVYVVDILLTVSDVDIIKKAKEYLKTTCDQRHGQAKNFLGIEIAHSRHEVVLSQRKYVFNLLQEVRLLGCKLYVLI